ncbi:MAG: methionine--tRNA ligase, partial [Deltaproteobacteria bacterium]
MERFYVTTPIYYVNDVPHLGHAYTTIAADVLARFHRACGHDTRFLTGTDEHGQKIQKAASAQGLEPIELADRVVERFRRLWERLDISYDDFIRTTEPRHQKVVQRLFEMVRDRGDIYLGKYRGLYCTGCEEYYTESQAEKGCCPIHKQPLEQLEEDSYFFRMSRYGDRLLEYIERHPELVQPDYRRNEITSFVRQGLRDLSISRTSFDWGVKVPGDPKHVIYVWFDALTNYISALGWDGTESGGELFERFWPAVHLIGKDILRFHAVYWPTFLMSAGIELPRTVFAHGWWTVEGEKMSKSLRNVVEPNMLVDTYGVDPVRYFLLREVPFGLDGDFSHQALMNRLNAELANDLGNLLRRTVSMVAKYCDGTIPSSGPAESLELSLLETAEKSLRESVENLSACAFHRALESIWTLVRAANRYIDEAAPWSLNKEGNTTRLNTVMAHALETLRRVAVMLWPFMPSSAERMLGQLGMEADKQSLDWRGIEGWREPLAGRKVRPGEPLFPRLDKDSMQQVLQKVRGQGTSGEGQEQPAEAGKEDEMDTIDIEQFGKVDLRVGLVKSAE